MCEEILQQAFPYLLDSRYTGPGLENPRVVHLHGGLWETQTEEEIVQVGDAMRGCHF